MAVIKIRKPFDGVRVRSSIDFLDENGEPAVGRTEQHHKDSTMIDTVLRKYDKTGLITHVNRATAQYGDFTTINEYQESLNLVMQAEDSFLELPSDIRKQFGNDAGAFFEFATNPDNANKLVEMGLAEAVQASVVEPAPEPAPDAV